MQSFPSGHTGTAFAAATILALYLNAKLKATSNYHTNFGKHLAVVSPLIGALLVAVGMIIDKVRLQSLYFKELGWLTTSPEPPRHRRPSQHPTRYPMRSPHLPVPILFPLQPPQQPHSPPLSLEQQALPTLQAQNTTSADALRRHANPSTRSGLVPGSR